MSVRQFEDHSIDELIKVSPRYLVPDDHVDIPCGVEILKCRLEPQKELRIVIPVDDSKIESGIAEGSMVMAVIAHAECVVLRSEYRDRVIKHPDGETGISYRNTTGVSYRTTISSSNQLTRYAVIEDAFSQVMKKAASQQSITFPITLQNRTAYSIKDAEELVNEAVIHIYASSQDGYYEVAVKEAAEHVERGLPLAVWVEFPNPSEMLPHRIQVDVIESNTIRVGLKFKGVSQ